MIVCMMCYSSTVLVCMQKHLSHCTGDYCHSFPSVTSKNYSNSELACCRCRCKRVMKNDPAAESLHAYRTGSWDILRQQDKNSSQNPPQSCTSIKKFGVMNKLNTCKGKNSKVKFCLIIIRGFGSSITPCR